jgi:gamma-tubulin complex component
MSLAWDQLERDVASAANLDDIVAAHARYLSYMEQELFLAPDRVELGKAVRISVHAIIFSDLLDHFDRHFSDMWDS